MCCEQIKLSLIQEEEEEEEVQNSQRCCCFLLFLCKRNNYFLGMLLITGAAPRQPMGSVRVPAWEHLRENIAFQLQTQLLCGQAGIKGVLASDSLQFSSLFPYLIRDRLVMSNVCTSSVTFS